MNALSLRQTGLQRMSAGLDTLGQAILDAGRGLYAILSGFVLIVAGIVLAPWMWIRWPFTRRAPVTRGDARRWKRFMNACRRVGGAALAWAAFALAAGTVIVGLALVLKSVDPQPGKALTDATFIIYPIILFLALGVICLVGWLALRLAAVLLAHLSRRLTWHGLRALAALAVVGLAAAAGAILYAVLKTEALAALIVGVAVFAGLAGFAFVSFGPSGIAIFGVGRWGQAPVRRKGRRPPAHARTIVIQSATSAVVARQAPGISPPPGAAPLANAPDVTAGPAGPMLPLRAGRKDGRKPWSISRVFVDRTGLMIVVAAILAILLAWGGGELLLRLAPGTFRPVIAPARPAASPSPQHASNPPGTGAAVVIQLSADGEPADVTWRSGYRQMTARLEDGRAVQHLALPASACGAGAIVAFGAASSDGARVRNERLAERRALWLAEWVHSELAKCPGPAPVLIAVSLGQARPGLPSPSQRSLRLLALPKKDARKLAGAADPTLLRERAQASFTGLDAFTRFDACVVTAQIDRKASQGGSRPCTTPQQ